jgi:hypothetical protein
MQLPESIDCGALTGTLHANIEGTFQVGLGALQFLWSHPGILYLTDHTLKFAKGFRFLVRAAADIEDKKPWIHWICIKARDGIGEALVVAQLGEQPPAHPA